MLNSRAMSPGRNQQPVLPLEQGLPENWQKAPGLVDSHAAVRLAPAVESLFGNADVFNGLHDSITLTLQDFNLMQLVNNLLGGVSFLCDDPVLLSVENTNMRPGPVFSIQVNPVAGHPIPIDVPRPCSLRLCPTTESCSGVIIRRIENRWTTQTGNRKGDERDDLRSPGVQDRWQRIDTR